MKFEIVHQSTRSRARVGKIYTPHGIIQTPSFVAVGTQGTLKALDNALVKELGLELMFCNTYHLLLQPGTDTIRRAGGLHAFIHRDLPIITDSGGFQVFSLAYGSVAKELKSQGTKQHGGSVLKISEEGVLFRSYRDGKKILLTPESSIQAQKDLGADIIIPFDELPPYHIPRSQLVDSLHRTHRWEERSLQAHLHNPQNQAIYGVVHGGIDPELRQMSCRFLRERPFDGFAIGGSLGKNREEMFTMLQEAVPELPITAPKHLLGIGDPLSLAHCITLGIDTFDSSYPTKAARHGVALVLTNGMLVKMNLTQKNSADCFEPIAHDCLCYTCQRFTRAYLHHLFKAKEISALTLTTIHNLYSMVHLMHAYRTAILANAL